MLLLPMVEIQYNDKYVLINAIEIISLRIKKYAYTNNFHVKNIYAFTMFHFESAHVFIGEKMCDYFFHKKQIFRPIHVYGVLNFIYRLLCHIQATSRLWSIVDK